MFSTLWRDATPVPNRLGWEHRVREGRDEWFAVTDAPHLVLSVMLLPPTRGGYIPFCARADDFRFAAFVDGMALTRVVVDVGVRAVNLDTITLFDDAGNAMAAAFREAMAQYEAMGINKPPTLLRLSDPAFAALIEERA